MDRTFYLLEPIIMHDVWSIE